MATPEVSKPIEPPPPTLHHAQLGSSPPPSDWNDVFAVTEQFHQQPKKEPKDERNSANYPGEVNTLVIDAVITFPALNLAATDSVLTLSNYRIRATKKIQSRDEEELPGASIDLPYCTIANVNNAAAQSNNGTTWNASFFDGGSSSNVYVLAIKTKDMRRFTIRLNSWDECDRVDKEIQSHAFFGSNVNCVFAYSYFRAMRDEQQAPQNRQWRFNVDTEFKRLKFPKSSFRVSEANKNYRLCPTYPNKMITVTGVSDNHLRESASFRSSRRLPAICWIHKNGATLSRCSQPKVGIYRAKSSHDEKYISKIFDSNKHYKKKNMAIFDCRSQMAANANLFKGGGTETTDNYTGVKMHHLNIDNIHAMRSSYTSLANLYGSTAVPEMSSISGTRWLSHVRGVMSGAKRVAEAIENDELSVLVHCSDGWDRTTQITSMVQLMLDPYFRTLEGFCILIQKEWLAFGHKFSDRIGHGLRDDKSNEISPIFQQWLDCVYQVLYQYPNWFEFNEALLIAIMDELYACRFGTFLYNCERQRKQHNVGNRTLDLWTHIANDKKLYKNTSFVPLNSAIYPDVSSSRLQVWAAYYARYNAVMHQHHLHKILSMKSHRSAMLANQEVGGLKEKLIEAEQKNKVYEALLQQQILENPDTSKEILELVSRTPDISDWTVQFEIVEGQSPKFKLVQKNETKVSKHFTGNLAQLQIDDYTQSKYRMEDSITQETETRRKEVEEILSEFVLAEGGKPEPNELMNDDGWHDNNESRWDLSQSTTQYVTLSLSKLLGWLGYSSSDTTV